MRLRKIHVRNFRNLRDVYVFPSKTTVIVGENNSGKTNFLHAMRLLLDPTAERLRIELSEGDINDAARAEGENWFSILVEIGDLQDHPEVETCFKERIAQEDDETYVIIEGTYERDNEGYFVFNVKVLPPQGRHNDPIPMRTRMYRAVPLHYLDALRDAERDMRATGRSAFAQLLDEVDFSDVESDVEQYLRSANDALGKGKEVTTLANGITSQLTQLIPGGQSQIKLSVSDENPLAIKRGLRLSIEKTPGSRLSDISRHGFGLQNLALIALFRHRVANSEFGVPILAIEEPEAHLHPHAQRRLFRDLTAVQVPVIITTHSTAIVKFADPLSLILFRSISDSTVPYQLDPPSLEEQDIKNLAQLLRGGRSELFFARSIIIVEGESELVTFPAFANALGCDLDRDGVSVLDAGGNEFAYILKSCGDTQFSIPVVINYDTDVLSKNNNLLREACKAGLIEAEVRDSWNNQRGKLPEVVRREILDGLGWFPAEECFEEEVCKNGYLDIVLQAISDNDPDHQSDLKALENYIQTNNLTKDPRAIASFIKKRETLKIPVARAVANAVRAIKQVPPCYTNAIRKAVLLSQYGILVDDDFERRAITAGFRNVFFETFGSQGLMDSYREFIASQGIRKHNIGVPRFLTETAAGIKMRPVIKSCIADAVETCGLHDYAERIRKTEFQHPKI